MGRLVVAACSIGLALAGCMSTAVLPPPPTPERVAPSLVPDREPPAGMGYVSIDTVGGEPARVTEPKLGVGLPEAGDDDRPSLTNPRRYTTVCPKTPCLALLTLGPHVLVFTEGYYESYAGKGTVTVTETPSAYRFALGHASGHARRWEGALGFFAWGTVGFGASAYALGDQLVSPGPHGVDASMVALFVGGMVVGGALAALGVWGLSQPMHEEREGAGVQWVPGAR